MSVRCKFKVDSITHHAGNGSTVEMTAVLNGPPTDENHQFWKWTPNGKLSFFSINEKAVASLDLGGEYYIDITPAPKV